MNEQNENNSKMETLMDPIRPSDGSLMSRDNMSYIYGRDPSILAYGHRPAISTESKVNLLSVFEAEESICHDSVASSLDSEALSLQTVKVYLRMKPFSSKIKMTKELDEAYKIINSTTLLTKLPCLDNTSVSMKKNSVDTVTRKFTFTETFGPETTQLAIFEQAMKPMLIKFLSGQNCTAMTYGTTNSGKSYTLQGTSSRPGIIPRSLEYVFANINPRSTPCYKPIYNCDVVVLSSLERVQELEIKSKLLSFNIPDKMQYINAYKQMQKMLEDESPKRTSQSTDAQYLVWVSFTEIYNETIYDLLSNECQKRRPPLKLATDHQGRPFIKGLKQICVNSGSEAYQVLMAGQYNLKVAATALNARSSRSHCIFTITVLKYYNENNPDSVEISHFSFCDLAGSERLKKTLNVGDRLKEAQNINTSLLVFGRCLKSIYDGQCIKQRNEHAGPFRDSKLTRLFQNSLSGKEHMALIVNVNPIPNLYIETQNVLNLAAIAKKIVIEPKKIKRKKNTSRFSLVVEQTQKTTTDWDDKTELLSIAEIASEYDDDDDDDDEEEEKDVDDDEVSVTQEDYEYLMEENEKLKKEISSLKSSNLRRDMNIREEMANLHAAMMAKLEENYNNRIKEAEQQQEDAIEWSVNQVEEYYKQKLNELRTRKRRRTNDDNDNDDDNDDDADDENDDSEDENEDNSKLSELKVENERLIEKFEAMKIAHKDLRKEKDAIEIEKNTLSYELGIAKNELKNANLLVESIKKDALDNTETDSYINELKKQLDQIQEKNKYLKQMLNEAKDDYINITDDCRQKEKKIQDLEATVLLSNEKIGELQYMSAELDALYHGQLKMNQVLEEKLYLQYQKINNLKKLNNESLNSTLSIGNDFSSIKIKQEIISPARPNNDNQSDILDKNQQLSNQDELQKQIVNQLNEKLMNSEAVNSALNEKLNDKLSEIKLLKDDVSNLKNILDQVTQDLENFKNSQPVDQNIQSDVQLECQTNFSEKYQADIDCQIKNNSEVNTSLKKPDYHDKSIQSSNNIDEEMEQVKKQFNIMQIDYENLSSQHLVESTRIKDLSGEIEQLNQELSNLKALSLDDKNKINSLTKDLTESYAAKAELEKTLKEMEQVQTILENKIVSYESTINEINTETEKIREAEKIKQQDLNKLNEQLDEISNKCKNEHQELIRELEEKLSQHEGSNNQANQVLFDQKNLLEQHVKTIENLEQQICDAKALKDEIDGLHAVSEGYNAEKKNNQTIIENNEKQIKLLEAQLEESKKKEIESELEIKRLEMSYKNSISLESRNEEISRMEQESKKMLKDLKIVERELSITRECNDQYLSKINTLEARIRNFELSQTKLDSYQRTCEDQKIELKHLKEFNEQLIQSSEKKDLEMEKFDKNRQDMVDKYEGLVRDLQTQIERQNHETDRLQKIIAETREKKDDNVFTAPSADRGRRNRDNRREKDDNTTDDESTAPRRPKRNIKKPAKLGEYVDSDMSVVELSGSETKRSTRRGTSQAQACASTEKKKPKGLRKLFCNNDDGLVDVVDNDEESRTATRVGLRSRKR